MTASVRPLFSVRAAVADPNFAKLDELEDLRDGWDGDRAEAPNAPSIRAARATLDEFLRAGVAPVSIAPSAEGGVALTFAAHRRYADIECLNSGYIVAVTDDGASEPNVWEVPRTAADLALAAARIRDFIAG